MKTVTTILAAALLTAASVQIASAAPREHRAHRAHAAQSQRLFDSNAYYAPDNGYAYGNRAQGLYEGGAVSAPAGR